MLTLRKITFWLKHNFWDIFFVLILASIASFISYKNYVPGTWLSGWDNLHPEFNFPLNIQRSFFAVWQEYQGVGVLGGMGHATALSRELILWLFSAFLPLSFLRYFWTFLMLAVGPIGVYFFISRSIFSKEKNRWLHCLSGFVGAIFYIFNYASLQTFYTPFETFISFYGFLPWLLLSANSYLKTGKKASLVAFIVVSLLGTSAFYVQTLFVVFAIFLFVFALESILRFKWAGIVRSTKLVFVTLIVNSFWLLPVLYFTFTSAAIPAHSHINSIATPETQLMNQARGNFTDIATLKGYWFDYYDWKQTRNDYKNVDASFDYLYKNWIDYSSEPNIQNLSLALFVISLIGIVLSLFKSNIYWQFSSFFLLIISYFMLATNNPPFGHFYELMTTKLPLLGDIFRNSFTKWSTATSLIYAIGLSLFVYFVGDLVKNKIKYFLGFIVAAVIVLASFWTTMPIVEGELISSTMRINIPNDYFETFTFFNSQDSSLRIANLPMINFFGWNYYDWDYEGSGFLWYGIKQPILDRAFDVWSPHNESFYNEANYAISYGTITDFEKVLTKYKVGFLLFDDSLFDPGVPKNDNLNQKYKAFLESSLIIHKVKNFGKVSIYKVDIPGVKSFVSAPKFASNGLAFANLKASQVPVPSGSPTVSETFSLTQGYPTAKNCDLKNKGSVTKTKFAIGNGYSATGGGSSCDYFYYPDMDYSNTYLIRIKGKNVTGRSLKVYLFNVKANKIDSEELFSKGDFDESLLVLPKPNVGKLKPGEGGYTLTVETRSFGNIKSENTITAIQIYQIDPNLLTKIASESVVGQPQNDLVIQNVQKYGTWAYKVDVQDGRLIQLSQGYEAGWRAFSAFDFQKGIQLPDLKHELQHFKLDSWSNGWLVPASNQSTASSSSVYIFFWPQLLEWGGMVLAIFTLLAIVSKRR